MNTCEKCGYEYDTITCPCDWYNDKYKGYLYATIDDFNQNTICDIQNNLIDDSTTKSILLYGPSGSGKTHMAIAIAKDLSVKYNLDYELIDPDTLSDLPSTRDQQLAHFRKVKLLIIDEFNDSFFLLLNQRIRNGLCTICTTNINIDKFDNKFIWRLNPYLITDSGLDNSKLKKSKIALYKKWKDYIDEVDQSNVNEVINYISNMESFAFDYSKCYTGIAETDTEITWYNRDGTKSHRFKN